MPGCSACGKLWPDHFVRCPEDGSSLTGTPVGSMIHGSAAPAYALSSNEDDLPAGSFAGEYRIERKIGEGGMGSVYGAKHPLIGKRAAIKVIRRALSSSREAVDRFVLEAQSVNQIGHPNIVDVFGFGQLPDGRSFFVMEWLEGESLRDRMQRPLPFPEALEMLEAIAKALQAAHEAGVVHRDLKPDNVFLQSRKGEKSQVKLLDFGLAKLTSGGDSQGFASTRTGVVMGTPLYLSPEQAKGQKVDAATDVYSLGAMAYEMLSGSVPFKADSAVEIMAMHISRPATPVADAAPWVPPEINALIAQMLEKDASVRPTTAEVRERIAACRARASNATIGIAIHPSSQPPPWTPNSHQGVPPTPSPYQPTPSPYQPTASPYVPTPGNMQYAQPAARKRPVALILVAVALIGAGVAFALVLAGRGEDKAPSGGEVAATDPQGRGSAIVTLPAIGSGRDVAVGSDAVVGSGSDVAMASDSGSAAPIDAGTGSAVPEAGSGSGSGAVAIRPDAGAGSATKQPVVVKRPDPPRKGKITVVFTGPPMAKVFIDGAAQGREASGRLTVELAPGEHTVRIQAKGYKPAVTKFRVDSGATRDVTLTLEKRRASVNTVHDPFAD